MENKELTGLKINNSSTDITFTIACVYFKNCGKSGNHRMYISVNNGWVCLQCFKGIIGDK